MTLSICGSATFLKEMVELQKKLEVFGFEVHTPLENGIDNLNHEIVVTPELHGMAIKNYCKIIDQSEGLVVANYQKNGVMGYIGASALFEMGYTFVNHKDIFLLNPIPDVPYRAEIEAMQPIVINGDLDKIQEYYQHLPLAYVSSENLLKTKAVSLGFTESGRRISVIGKKVDSGVDEEPSSVESTYRGAVTRLENLKKYVGVQRYNYLVSIEGGMAKIINDQGFYDIEVCVIENANGERHRFVYTNFEYPKEMTDLVPSVYPDTGVVAQQKYGQKNKDPFLVFTHGRISRFDLLKTAVANTLALFE